MRSCLRVLVVLLFVATGHLGSSQPADASSNSFVDDDNSRFEPFIERALTEGLIKGCNPPANDRVCPHQTLSRGEMAMMLARAIQAPAPANDYFSDDNGHPAERAINGLMDTGMGISCGDDRICPDRPITRGEMATWLDRVFEIPAREDAGRYADLGDTTHAEALVDLAAAGALLACDSPVNQKLCPHRSVDRDEAVFALVTVLGLGPAPASSSDPALEPLGFGDGFHHLSLWDGRRPSSRNNVALTGHGYRESGLRVRIPKGSHFGADFHLHLDDAAHVVPERLFFRYFLKLDADWRTTTSGKLPGFSGVYGSTGKGGFRSDPSQPGWSARLMFSPNDSGDQRVGLGYYVYHLGQERRYGDGLSWNEAGQLQPGEWYCLEGEVEMNTPGMTDGALRAWVDETPALDVSGLEFRRPSEPEIKIESFWFNVYYGGKPVALRDLGMIIDEVMVDTERIGCGAGEGLSSPTDGDFDGDGYRDQIRWDTCDSGSCFVVQRHTWHGLKTTRYQGNGAWFSLATHRLGVATGDVDGDGGSDVVYHGRCDASVGCWRVHTAAGGMDLGENWGDGARFAPETESLLLGDWDGDGLDDLAYIGLCGDDGRRCWRVHPSTGATFGKPAGWGAPTPGMLHPGTVDLNHDGRDDIVFQAPCDESLCWFARVSSGEAFERPTTLGMVLEGSDKVEWIDFDGDGQVDIVSWINTDDTSWVEVRFMRDGQLGGSVRLAQFDGRVGDVALRRRTANTPVQAIVSVTCGEETCFRTLMAPSSSLLVDSERFREERWKRPEAPHID